MSTKNAKKSRQADEGVVVRAGSRLRYSISLVTQGKHRFYTLSMPSEVLAQCCFATNRHEDPIAGFQRVLDKRRAEDIATYIDNDMGTIPSAIVLSAQPEAEVKVLGSGKTLEFTFGPHAFLILDGQHRVYGFSLARTNLRVPVVIYSGLTKQEESRLFIDINTKQKPVPNELLLDIKQLAQYESSREALLRATFDRFGQDPGSALVGLLSPSSRRSGRISRVTFNHAMKAPLTVFREPDEDLIYSAVNAYLLAVSRQMRKLGVEDSLTTPTVFRGLLEAFPQVAQRVFDRFSGNLGEQEFLAITEPMFDRVKASLFAKPPKSHNAFAENLLQALRQSFQI